MNIKYNNNNIFQLIFWAGLLLLYILFPTQTHSVDAWGYAANVKFGQDLFSPHHLLYNACGFIIKNAINSLGFYPDVMWLLVLINGIAAWFSVLILYYIVRTSGHSKFKSLVLVSVAAFSFGMWRFSTENEAYILPLFFSLLASYCFVLFHKKFRKDEEKNLLLFSFLSGFFAVLACLFHQIHIFWWLGLCGGFFFLVFRQNIRFWLIFTMPVILLPIAYLLVLKYYNNQQVTFNNLWQFINHDVYSGAVGGKPGLKHFVLAFLNLVRSFFQLHGSVIFLLKKSIIFFIPGILSFLSVIYAAIIFWRNRLNVKVQDKPVFYTFLLIFIMQWLFALYNVGNAEFMVMLPAILVILLAAEAPVPANGLIAVSFALLSWNSFYGILPNNIYRFSADEKIAEIVHSKPDAKFILEERGVIFRKLFYMYAKELGNTFANPAYYASRPDKNINLKAKIDSLLDSNVEVYTDCTGRPVVLNRARMLDGATDKSFFRNYKLYKTDSFPTLAGTHFLYKITK